MARLLSPFSTCRGLLASSRHWTWTRLLRTSSRSAHKIDHSCHKHLAYRMSRQKQIEATQIEATTFVARCHDERMPKPLPLLLRGEERAARRNSEFAVGVGAEAVRVSAAAAPSVTRLFMASLMRLPTLISHKFRLLSRLQLPIHNTIVMSLTYPNQQHCSSTATRKAKGKAKGRAEQSQSAKPNVWLC